MQAHTFGSDVFSKEKRSEVMSRVRSSDTKPERAVRSALHRLGYRFRLHRRDLPGKPDIVLPRLKTVIFVHGCFWHQHGCKKSKLPQQNAAFWQRKLLSNVARDGAVTRQLAESGWKVVVIWECQFKQGRPQQLSLLERELRGGHRR